MCDYVCSLCDYVFDPREFKRTFSFIPRESLLRYVDYKVERMLEEENKASTVYVITSGGEVLEVLEELQADEGITLRNLVTAVSGHALEGQYMVFVKNVQDTANPFCVAKRAGVLTRDGRPRGFTLTPDDCPRNDDTIIHLGCPTFKIQADAYDASATLTVVFLAQYDTCAVKQVRGERNAKHPPLASGFKCNACDRVIRYLIATLAERKKALCEYSMEQST